ncbi:MAG TPA: oligosaccharide flippase family protein [Steroidobacter sp.]
MIAVSTRWRRVGDLALGTGLVQAANVLTYILLARLLTPVEYGSYRQLFLLNQVFWAVGFSALPVALNYFGASAAERSERAAVIRLHLRTTAIIAAVPALVLALGAAPIAGLLNNPALTHLLPLYAPYPAAYMFHSLVATVMIVQQRTKYVPVYMAAAALVTSVPVLIAAGWVGELRIVVMAASASAMLCAAGAIVVSLALSRDPGATQVRLPNIMAYAVPLLAAAGIGTFALKLDQFAVARLLGTATFAVYAVGAFELPLYSLLKSASTTAIMPELTAAAQRKDWDAILGIWHDLLRKNAAMIFPVSAALVTFAHEFVVVLFGERYAAAAPILALFSLLGPIRAVTFGLILRAFGYTSADLAGAVFFLVAVAIALGPAIGFFGVQGAAATVVIATVLVAVLIVLLTVRISGGRVRAWQLYPPRYLLIYAALLGALTVLQIMMILAGLNELGRLILAGLIAAAVSFLWLPEARRRLWRVRA